MRVADKMNFEQVKSSLSKNRAELADLQSKAATQKRVTRPSDDPVAASRVLSARTDITTGKQFIKSIEQARTFLEYSEQSLAELSDLLNRAKELAISQANDASANDISRQATAAEIQQLFQQTVQIGNRKLGDRFLFGGYKTTRAPFDSEGRYHGDSGEIKISIQKEGAIAMNVPGDRIFLGRNINAPTTTGPDRPILNTEIRGPASEAPEPIFETNVQNEEGQEVTGLGFSWKNQGVNIFQVLRDLEIGLRANDKQAIQESLDLLDEAAAQVVLARSLMGARVSTLNSALESHHKGQVDAKTLQSQLEDVDTFELVSDLNKSESTLKASLATSGKLLQPSLLDFLK